MNRPLVSVVVSTYAAERLIVGCVEMLLGQTLGERLEIIVVDSGSPEGESALLKPYVRAGRIRYLRTERETLYAAWNRGLAMATGEYLANVNVDDWVAPHALECLADALESNPDCALAYADWAETDTPASPPTPRHFVCRHARWQPAFDLFFCYSGCVQFWRLRDLQMLGGFDASLVACGDLRALHDLAAAGMRPVYVPEVLFGFFRNPDGISHSSDVALHEQLPMFQALRDDPAVDRLFAIDPLDPQATADAWTALGVLAMQLRIPWHAGPLRDLPFALACFERALAAAPGHADALHDRYAVLFEAGRFEEAEASLAALDAEAAIDLRGQDLALRCLPLAPTRVGAVWTTTRYGRST